jgi:hypothetical protein
MQYDIPLSTDKHTLYLSLILVKIHSPTETWNNTTVRAGVALKFGQGKNSRSY